MHTLAATLNRTLESQSPAVMRMLSERGKALYFPKTGILGQTAEAKGKKFNATIGIANEDDGSPLHLRILDPLLSLSAKEIYPYASSYGHPDLRALWLKMMKEKNPGLTGQTTVPVVTCALTHGLCTAMDVFLEDGEQILLPDFYWDNYTLLFEDVSRGKLMSFPTFSGKGFNLEGLRASLSSTVGKKVVLLNFPNNPCGYTPTDLEAQEICDILRERAEAGDDLVVILDDAYFGLVYEEGVYRESLFGPLSTLHERVLAVKIDGPTKEDYAWGFRVGFITAAGKALTQESATALEDKLAGSVRARISNASLPSQSLLLRAYQDPGYGAEKARAYALLKTRYEAVKAALTNPECAKYLKILPFNSGYFMCVEPIGLKAEDVRKHLLANYDTGVVALGNLLRIAFSSIATAQIPSFFQNLCNACKDLSSSTSL